MREQNDWARLMLRVPPNLKIFVETEAARNGSSQNSEIVRCIRERMDRLRIAEASTASLPPA